MAALNMAEELWAWMTRYPDGSIGTVAAGFPGLGITTLAGRSKEAVLAMESIARAHGRAAGQEVWLRRYTMAEDIGRARDH